MNYAARPSLPHMYTGPVWLAVSLGIIVGAGLLVGAFVVWQRDLSKPRRGPRYTFRDGQALPAILDVDRDRCRGEWPAKWRAGDGRCQRCRGRIDQ